MATIRPAQPVSAISGPLGNVSLRRARAVKVPTIDAPPLPTPATEHPTSRLSVATTPHSRRPTRTPAQNRAAQEARAVAASWRALSDAQRQAWESKAAGLQLTEDPATEGQWCGWSLYSAVHRRFLLAGATPPTIPGGFDGIRVDRPWPKIWAHTTPGQLRVFWEPVSSPFPPPGSVACLYASPPHPASRTARSGRERFVYTFDPVTVRFVGSAVTVTVAPPERCPPGSIIDVAAVTATPEGEVSARWRSQVRTPAAGWGVAFIWWTYSVISIRNGIELGADRILRAWAGDYPTGTPATLDTADPGVDLADVRSFLEFETDATDTQVVNPALMAAPASVLPVIRRHRRTHQQGAFSFFAPL